MNLENEITQLKEKIDKLKFHNINLITLVGNMIDGEVVSNSIYELSIMLDLSKQDLQKAQQLITDYDGDFNSFLKKATNAGGNISEKNIVLLAKSFNNSGMLLEETQRILEDKEKLI